MKKYKADLGSWEAGVSVEFESEDKSAALIKAEDLLQDAMFDESITQFSIIVQIFEEITIIDQGHTRIYDYVRVYDYINGMIP